ncbi:MAG: SseB family protein [Lachnospiraceae bacterium]|nr:SseB family protein [Lachnospiraceae bacterium]
MNSQELEEILDRLTETKDAELAHQFMKEVQDSIVILPAIMPPDTDPALLKQMQKMAKDGTEQPLPKDANPKPCVLEDKKGNKLFPVFTSIEHLEKDKITEQFPVRLNIPFGQCVQLLGQTQDVRSIVVNPFTHNFQVDFKIEEKDQAEDGQLKNGEKITEAQFHALVRQHVEANLLPRRLFTEQDSLMKEITEGGKSYILDLFKPPYNQNGSCPYTEEDFDILSLMIRDDLQIIQISLPGKHLYVGTCSKVFLVWNPEKQEAAYYAIVLSKEKRLILHQAFEDGTNKELSEAPAEGSELQTIIDLHS